MDAYVVVWQISEQVEESVNRGEHGLRDCRIAQAEVQPSFGSAFEKFELASARRDRSKEAQGEAFAQAFAALGAAISTCLCFCKIILGVISAPSPPRVCKAVPSRRYVLVDDISALTIRPGSGRISRGVVPSSAPTRAAARRHCKSVR